MQCSGFERLGVKDLGSGPRLLFAGVVYRSCRSGTGSTVLNIRGLDECVFGLSTGPTMWGVIRGLISTYT